ASHLYKLIRLWRQDCVAEFLSDPAGIIDPAIGLRVLPLRLTEETRRDVSSRILLGPELASRLRAGVSSKRGHQDQGRRRTRIFSVPPGNRLDPSCRESIATRDAPGRAGQRESVRNAR